MDNLKGKVVAVIPARYASSRFKGKMLADILDKSLIRRTYENTKRCHLLDEVVVATDDQRIFDHVESFGGRVFMTGPHASGTDRVATLVKEHCPQAEIVVNVQGDEPCLEPEVVEALVRLLQDNQGVTMATPVTPVESEEQFLSSSIVKCVFDKEMRALYFSRNPIPYGKFDAKRPPFRHIGVYAFRGAFLEKYSSLPRTPLQESEDLEQLKILEHGYPLHVCHVRTSTIGVDTPDDIKEVERYLCREDISLLQGA